METPEEVLAADVREEADGKALARAKVIARLLELSTDDIFRPAERTRWRSARMSALGQKKTLERASKMSALPPRADILGGGRACPLSARSGHWPTIRLKFSSRVGGDTATAFDRMPRSAMHHRRMRIPGGTCRLAGTSDAGSSAAIKTTFDRDSRLGLARTLIERCRHRLR